MSDGPVGTSDARHGRLGAYAAGTAFLAGAAIVTQVLGFAGTLVNARLYGPADVGFLALFIAVWALGTLAATLRYELAIVTADNDAGAGDTALLVVCVALLAAGAMAFCLSFASLLPKAVAIPSDVERMLVFLPLTMVVGSMSLAGSHICVRRRHFGRLAVQQISASLVTVGAQVSLVGTEVPGGGLIFGFFLGQLAGVLVVAGSLLGVLLETIRQPHVLGRLRQAAQLHRDYPLYTTPYSLVTAGFYQSPVVLLGLFYSAHDVGVFSLAFRTTTTPFGLLPNAIGQVLFPEFARDKSRISHWEQRLTSVLIALGILQAPAAAVVLALGPDLYAVLLGNAWRESGLLAQIMVIPNFLMMLAGGYDRIYFALGRQRMAFLLMCGACVISIVSMAMAVHLDIAAIWTVGIWAAVQLGFALVWMAGVYQAAAFSRRSLAMALLAIAAVVGVLAAAFLVKGALLDGEIWALTTATGAIVLYALIVARLIRPLLKLLPSQPSNLKRW